MIVDLEQKARRIRRHIIESTGLAGSGHPGGSLSCADLVTALFFAHLRHDPSRPDWEERDRFVLSKGHAAPVLYAALAEAGYFPVDELKTLRKLGSRLHGHPSLMAGLPGIEASTGSLGHGLSLAVGMALAARLDRADWLVYALLGDGDCQEGSTWEAAMSAAHYGLGNLVAIVDNNGLQIDGRVAQVMETAPLAEKWAAFGWDVQTVDGHDFEEVLDALETASGIAPGAAGARPGAGEAGGPRTPRVIIARTTKGKGVSFMENVASWHGQAPRGEQLARALAELAG